MRVVIVVFLAWLVGSAQAADLEVKYLTEEEMAPAGLFYQIEDWAEPKDAWVDDGRSPGKWNLTSEQGNCFRENNGGKALLSPLHGARQSSREEGAPPLHVRIEGIPAGRYAAFLNDTCQAVSISFDGEAWSVVYPSHPGFGIPLGAVEISEGCLEIWLDDYYEDPYQSGPVRLDYVRLIPAGEPKVSQFETTVLGNGQTRLTWLTDTLVPACDLAISDEVGRVVRFNTEGIPKTSHELLVPDLAYGKEYTLRVTMRGNWGDEFESDPIPLSVTEPEEPTTKPKKVLMTVDRALDAAPTSGGGSFPVRSGIPFVKGILADPADVLLASATSGAPIPAQFDALSRYDDGTIQWLLADFLAPAPEPPAEGSETKSKYIFVVRPEGGKFNPIPEQPATAQETKDALILDSGYLVAVIDKESPSIPGTVFFDRTGNGRYTKAEKVLSGEGEEGLYLTDAEGRRCAMGPIEEIKIEDPGPVRTTVRLRGSFIRGDGSPCFRYDCRISCWGGTSLMKLEMTLGNDIVTQASSTIRSWELSLPVEGVSEVRPAEGGELPSVANSLSLLQDSDNHFTANADGETVEGNRFVAAVSVTNETATLSASIRDFWQTYPKGLSADDKGLSLELLPSLPENRYPSEDDRKELPHLFDWCADGTYAFKRGMQYTTEVFLRWGEGGEEGELLDFANLCQDPPFAVVPSSQYCSSGAFGLATPAQDGFFPKYEAMIGESFEKAEAWREEGRNYGWCNDGDLFNEVERSWSDNGYDLTASWIVQFARTGNLRYLQRARDMAKHNIDIDIIHGPEDPAYGVLGIVDGCPYSHLYKPGNFLSGFLLGERRFVAESELAADRLSTFLIPQLLVCGDEHLDTVEVIGWPLINTIAAYEATGNKRFLNDARSIASMVIERQDSETGMLPVVQDGKACGCERPHLGGRPAAIGILLRGLIDLHRVDPGKELGDCIVRLTDWLMEYAWDEEKGGYRVLVPCPQTEDLVDVFAALLLTVDAFPFAYEHTGSARYSNFGVRVFGKAVKGRPDGPREFGQSIRHGAAALHDVYRWGIKELP